MKPHPGSYAAEKQIPISTVHHYRRDLTSEARLCAQSSSRKIFSVILQNFPCLRAMTKAGMRNWD